MQARKVGAQISDLSLIEESGDPKWQFLMENVMDKRHFYQAAFAKVGLDA